MIQISILIPTYKRPQRVIEAIESCLAQTYAPLEIIIGDDSPDDLTQKSIEILQKSSTISILYFHNRPSLGEANNVNELLTYAKGDKIMLLHDDDLILPEALQTLVTCFNENPGISMAYGKQYIITDNGKVSVKRSEFFNKSFYRTKKYEGIKLSPLEAGLLQQIPINAYLMNTDLARNVRYQPVGDVCDFDFGLRLGQTGEKFFFIDKYTAKYRISNVSISNQPLSDSGLTAFIMVKSTPVPPASEPMKYKWMRDRSGVAVGQAIANKKYRIAMEIYFSRYHMRKIFTPGGIKRFLTLAWGQLGNSKKSKKFIEASILQRSGSY